MLLVKEAATKQYLWPFSPNKRTAFNLYENQTKICVYAGLTRLRLHFGGIGDVQPAAAFTIFLQFWV
jgi:hypothetical protein